MKQIFLFAILLLSSFANASHIVGGEFELISKGRGYAYVLNLNLYFDDINGNPAAEDDAANVHIFDKKTNTWIETINLLKITNNEFINYTNPDCEINSLSTRIIKYSAEIYLNPEDYGDPEGYYVIWERCCRNMIIDNIYYPDETGMTFYMEFPPAVKNSIKFINTSPLFDLPFGDFACVGQLYEYDFSAWDPNGDSLVYSLVTPYAGYSSQFAPIPSSVNSANSTEPFYPEVDWANGFSLSNVTGIPSIPMKINAFTGKLSVTPAFTGLFVFSVLCEEFRDGLKIGAVKRDYQLLVIDCPLNEKPEVNLQLPDTTAFYTKGDTLLIITADSTDKWCYQLAITDSNINENVTVKIIPKNFSSGIITLSQNQGVVTDTLKIDLCWDDCRNIQDTAAFYIFDIVVQDNGCPVPKTDTLNVILLVIPKPNDIPRVTIENFICIDSLNYNIDCDTSYFNSVWTIEMIANNSIMFDVVASDPDSDLVTLYAFGEDFNLQDYGMSFNDTSAIDSVRSQFYWKTDCYTAERIRFVVNFVVDDNTCFESHKDTVSINFIVRDIMKIDTFFVPNIFTPNNDGINECFEIRFEKKDLGSEVPIIEDINQFPRLQQSADNFGFYEIQKASCKDYFFNIEIYNRWGRLVFKDNKKDFKWCGERFPDGVYFYLISFSESDYFKGTVTILR